MSDLLNQDGEPILGQGGPDQLQITYDEKTGRFQLAIKAKDYGRALHLLSRASHRVNLHLDGADAARLKLLGGT